jgi:hypothetical protein
VRAHPQRIYSTQNEMRFPGVDQEGVDNRTGTSKQRFNIRGRAIANAKPDKLGRTATQQAPLLKIGILGNDGKSVIG